MKKILFYNWIEFDDPLRRGGGVTVYQKNLIEKMIEDDDVEVSFFCSGRTYDMKNKEMRIVEEKTIFGDKCKSFVVINSPILAPAALSFNDVKTYLYDETLSVLLEKFILDQGGYDVIHFNNMEGLTLNVLKLKEKFNNTRFIFSVHNYYMFCPQVNLWKSEVENCPSFNEGRDCINCMRDNVNKKKVKKKLAIRYGLGSNPCKLKQQAYNLYGKVLDIVYTSPKINNKEKQEYAEMFNKFRNMNVLYLNKYVDSILAVSKRVKEIGLSMGLNPDKVYVNYIGTKFAENKIAKKKINEDDILNVAYLGYMRRDKGFFFLLDALKDVDEDIAKRIAVKLACKISNKEVLDKIEKLRSKYAKITIIPGYTHDNLAEILKDIDLGIIPVLWEDNLPQVAIEMHAHGVPVLASSLGGASELSNSKYFKYSGGQKDEFISKLKAIVENREILSYYWNEANSLKTMDGHICELKKYYGMNKLNESVVQEFEKEVEDVVLI